MSLKFKRFHNIARTVATAFFGSKIEKPPIIIRVKKKKSVRAQVSDDPQFLRIVLKKFLWQ